MVDNSEILLLHSKIQLSRSGIVEIDVFDNVIINKACTKELLDGLGKLLKESKKYPLMCVYGRGVEVDDSAKKYGVSDEGTKYSSAEAYVLTSPLRKMLLNSKLKFFGSKANIPTKYFTDRKQANAWLLKYIE